MGVLQNLPKLYFPEHHRAAISEQRNKYIKRVSGIFMLYIKHGRFRTFTFFLSKGTIRVICHHHFTDVDR